MKYMITIILCINVLSIVVAQPSQLEKDTTKAKEYLEKALSLNNGSIEKIKLLEKAVALYELYDLPKKIITTNSHLVYQYAKIKSEKTITIGQKNIDFATAKLKNDKLPELALTYVGMQDYLIDEDFDASGAYGEVALQLLPQGSDDYFKVSCRLMQFYVAIGDDIAFENIIEQIKRVVESTQGISSKLGLFSLYYGQFMYNYLYENNELIITYGQQLLLEIQQHELDYDKRFIYEQVGFSYGVLGQQQKAIEWITKLKKPNGTEAENIDYYYSISALYLTNDLYDKAIPFFQKAINVYENDSHKDSKIQLRVLYEEITYCYLKIEQYGEAEKKLLKAYQYESPYEPYIVDIYYAILLNHTARYDKGLEYIQKALIKVSANFDNSAITKNPITLDDFESHDWAALALSTKAKLLLNKYKTTNDITLLSIARQTTQTTIDLYIQLQENNRGYAGQQLYSNVELSNALQLLQDIEYEQYLLTPTKVQLNILFKITERCKALTLLETLLPEGLPTAVLEEEEELVHTIQQLEHTLAALDKSLTDSLTYYQNALTAATYDFDQFQVKLLKQYPKEVMASYRFTPIDIPTIQQSLSAQALWVEYAYNETKTVLYIYGISQTAVTLQTIPIDADFFKDIELLQRLLKNRLLVQEPRRKEFIAISNRLYKKLLLPIEAALKNCKDLYLVPEKELFNIPFEVLLPTDEIKPYESLDYIIRQYAIGYHYSATTFFRLQTKSTVKDNSLLGFAPVFNNSSSISSTNRSSDLLKDSLYQNVERNQFIPLPNSKEEIETINGIVHSDKPAVILLEEQATKANLINALNNQSYQYVHLATHGLVDFENHELSALACFNNKKNHSLLFANEITMQEIDVDLVVLSSCESGIGKLIGNEGLIALNRSFIHAGAKNVVFSLWKVDDKHSSELMINFYKSQLEPTTYMNALRLAKLELLEKRESALPRYWAAFVLIGE